MKILWAFIVVVLVAGAWMALRPAGSGAPSTGQPANAGGPSRAGADSPPPEPEATGSPATPLSKSTPSVAVGEAPGQPASGAPGSPAAAPVVAAEPTAPAASERGSEPLAENAKAAEPATDLAATPATALPAANPLNDLLGLDVPVAAQPSALKKADEPAAPAGTPSGSEVGGDAPAASTTGTAPGDAAPPADAPAGDAVTLELSDEVRGKFKEIAPSRARRTADGFLLLDERFPVKGDGTREKPYELTWEMLVSASETFQPRMGKLRMPERIAMLDKRHVRITGYVAFPIMASAQNEMLSMRNMWDGCCIGVPPTPYDAIEVKLGQAATGKERFTSFGAVEGVFRVDPYVKGNWLLGLYLLEEASLVTIKEGQDPTKHRGM